MKTPSHVQILFLFLFAGAFTHFYLRGARTFLRDDNADQGAAYAQVSNVILYMHAAERDEQTLISSPLATEYAAYKSRVPAFLPRRPHTLAAR